MRSAHRVVVELPLAEIWRSDGFVTSARGQDLTEVQVASLLKAGRVQFVVANLGAAPEWIPLENCFEFWKGEARPHLAAPDAKVELDDYVGGYCYFASAWTPDINAAPLVVLEKHH